MTQLLGKYRAYVVDNKDPEERGRLLVKCPAIMQEYELGWAESCLPPGVFLIPEKDATVYIEFEDGNLDYPVWVGILATNKYVKETFFASSSYDPAVKMIVTKEHKLVLNDKTKNAEITSTGDFNVLPVGKINLGSGGQPIARKGDGILGGVINAGSSKVNSA